MKKYFNLIFVVAIVLFAITGCGGNPEEDGKTVVTFWHAMGGQLETTLTNMIDQFNKENPDILVKPQCMGNYQTLSQKLMAASQVGNNPTIAQAYEAWTQNFIDAGIVEPIQSYIDKEKMDLTDFYSVMIDNNIFNDKIYSFPFNKSMPVLYVNMDMLKTAGIKKIPETHDELMKAYEILSTNKAVQTMYANPVKGTAFSARDAWNFFCLLQQNGGKLTNKNETEAYLNSEPSKKSLKFMLDTIKNDYGYLTQGYEHQTEFLAKKVGIIMSSSVSKSYMENDKVTFNWASAPLTHNKTKSAILSGTNVLIFNNNPKTCNEKQKEAGWKFIKWFTDRDQTAHWSIETNYMPVRKSSLKTEIMIANIAKDPLIKAALDQLPIATFEPKSSKWFQCRQVIGEILEECLTEKNPEINKYLEKIDTTVNSILKGE
ncbi:MAG: ABC transporter substrate-binding protein [Candidatus Muirbacterium halophilum]|nr:ABC transporter substrate-binding protein [Candidatus Muirbacterium halophilum]MCK9474732.1 ABC transporter substrate-binding protein [Candidatus Muirbacterium halophilum]